MLGARSEKMPVVKVRVLVAAVLAAAALTACDVQDDELVVIGADDSVAADPAYDASLEPAAAVLALVPDDATLLEVTDFDQVRLQLGFGDMSSESDRAERARFWRVADERAPLLSPGLLRDPAAAYEQRFGFTQDDVSWEARFSGPSGEGYVVKLRDDLALDGVQQAVAASDGPIAGAAVDDDAHLVTLGTTGEPTQSWAADPTLRQLVGSIAGATYLSRACLPLDVGADLAALDELGAFSVSFGGRLATARLGPVRGDVFDRARLPTDAEFARAYASPVADPQSGRIGYTLADPAQAARLALEQRLPFAVCAPA